MKSLRFRSALVNSVLITALGLAPLSRSEAAPPVGGGLAPKILSAVEGAAGTGFAGMLPQTTEFYVGSANFKAQLDALKGTAFWKEISAIMEDKTPAPAAGDKSMAALQKLWGDDWFMAGSAGMTGFMKWAREFNNLYNELNFRALMTGATGEKAAPAGNALPGKFIQPLLQDPQQIDRAQRVIAGFDLPPIMIGFKVQNPAELAKQLIPDELFNAIPAGKASLGKMTTPSGAVFKTLTTDGSRLLADADKQDILAKLPADLPPAAKKAIEKTLSDFQGKTFAVGWGAVGDYLIFAIGKNLDHVKFADSPETSLLAKAEMKSLTPYLTSKLFGLAYFSAEVLTASQEDQPFTPMLRGVVGAMKESPVFHDMASAVDKQLDELSRREVAVFHRDMVAMSSAFWWDHGVHLESFGGAKARVYQNGKPLQFARLLDQPGVVAAWAYVRNKAYEQTERAWFEQFATMLYHSTQELVKLGMLGPQAAQQFAMFDQVGAPLLKKIYQARVDISEKALDGETAGLLDINGKMPAFPGLPPEANGMKIPRFTVVSHVSNRAEIAPNWKIINDSVVQAINTFSNGGQPNGPGAGAGAGLPSMEPMSSDKNGVTTYFYMIPFLSGDLLPCTAVSDQLLMIGTSKDAAEAIAGELAKGAAPKAVDGLVWRLDPGLLVEYIASLQKMSPTRNPSDERDMKQILKWAKPFHAMQAHCFEENNAPRTSFTWEITDLVSFD